MKSRILLFLLIFQTFGLFADHAAGGYMEYRHISGNTYEISFYFLRDCSGIELEPVHLFASNDCAQTCTNLGVMAVVSTNWVDFGCGNTCDNSVGYPGFQKIVLRKQVQLSYPCDSWKFSVNVQARNTVDFAEDGVFYSYCKINNIITNSSSPNLEGVNLIVGCSNNLATSLFTLNASPNTDATYTLSSPLNKETACTSQSIIYHATLSAQQPFPSTAPFSINNTNGEVSFTPTALGTSYFGVLAKSYQNGNYLGEIMIEGMIIISACPPPGNVLFGHFPSSNAYLTVFQRGNGGKFCESISVISTGTPITDIDIQSPNIIVSNVTMISNNVAQIEFCIEEETPSCVDLTLNIVVNVKTNGGNNCLSQANSVGDARTYTIHKPKASPCRENVVVTNINTSNNSGYASGTSYYKAQQKIYVGDEFPPGLTDVPPGDVEFDYYVTFEAGEEVVIPSCADGGSDCVTLLAGATALVSPNHCSVECMVPLDICTSEYFECNNERIDVKLSGGLPPFNVKVYIQGILAGVEDGSINHVESIPIQVNISNTVKNMSGNIQYHVVVTDNSGMEYTTQPKPLVGTKRFYEPLENNMQLNSFGEYKYLLNFRVRNYLPVVFLDDVNTSPPYYGATWFELLVFDRWDGTILHEEKNIEGTNTWSFDNGEIYWNGHFNNNINALCASTSDDGSPNPTILYARNCASATVYIDCLEDLQPPASKCGYTTVQECYTAPVPWNGFTDAFGQDIYYIAAGNFGNAHGGYTCNSFGSSGLILSENNNLDGILINELNNNSNEINVTNIEGRRNVKQRNNEDLYLDSLTLNFAPNPFSDIVSITGDIEELSHLNIYDSKQQLVQSINPIEKIINLAKEGSGVYIVQAIWKNGAITSQRIVKL